MGRGEGLFVYLHLMTSPVVFETVLYPGPVAVSSKARPLTLVVRVERERSLFVSSCFLFQEKVVASPLDLLFLVTW